MRHRHHHRAHARPKGSVHLYDVLATSYDHNSESRKRLEKHGYELDSDLSSHNQSVLVNKYTKKVIYTVAGTHNMDDVSHDILLATGNLKNSTRFDEARDVLTRSRAKYQGYQTTLAGHSLGGAIVSYLGRPDERIVSYNKGMTIGQGTRANETAIRSSGDWVSALGSAARYMSTIPTYVSGAPILAPHSTENLKHVPVWVD